MKISKSARFVLNAFLDYTNVKVVQILKINTCTCKRVNNQQQPKKELKEHPINSYITNKELPIRLEIFVFSVFTKL